MKYVVIGALSLLSTQCLADVQQLTFVPLLVQHTTTILEVMDGGRVCGPLVVRDYDGKELLRLEKDKCIPE